MVLHVGCYFVVQLCVAGLQYHENTSFPNPNQFQSKYIVMFPIQTTVHKFLQLNNSMQNNLHVHVTLYNAMQYNAIHYNACWWARGHVSYPLSMLLAVPYEYFGHLWSLSQIIYEIIHIRPAGDK